jgi:hypothetical protein
MDEAPEDGDEAQLPRDLRFLKGLVTVLTAVMIGGVIAIVTLLVIRLNADPPAPVVVDPGLFPLPDGVTATGISIVDGRTVIVGGDGVIRVYDSDSRALLDEIDLP